MAEFLVDSHDAGSPAITENLSSSSTSIWKAGQSFTGQAGNLSSCKFYLKKTGSPTGNAVAELYAHTGTFGTSSIPTGSVLAISGNLDVSTLTTSYVLTTFTFSGVNKYKLAGNTYYCIVISYGNGNGSNYLTTGGQTTDGTGSGNHIHYDISTWVANSIRDTYFYVYAEPAFIPQIIMF